MAIRRRTIVRRPVARPIREMSQIITRRPAEPLRLPPIRAPAPPLVPTAVPLTSEQVKAQELYRRQQTALQKGLIREEAGKAVLTKKLDVYTQQEITELRALGFEIGSEAIQMAEALRAGLVKVQEPTWRAVGDPFAAPPTGTIVTTKPLAGYTHFQVELLKKAGFDITTEEWGKARKADVEIYRFRRELKEKPIGDFLALEQGNVEVLKTGQIYDEELKTTRPITIEERRGYEYALQLIRKEKENLLWIKEWKKHYESGEYRKKKISPYPGAVAMVFKYTGEAAPLIGGQSSPITWERYLELRTKWSLEEHKFANLDIIGKIFYFIDALGPTGELIYLAAGYGAGRVVGSVARRVIPFITGKLPAVTRIVAPVTRVVARPAVMYPAIGGLEAYRAYEMYRAGVPLEDIATSVGRNIVFIAGFGWGFGRGIRGVQVSPRLRPKVKMLTAVKTKTQMRLGPEEEFRVVHGTLYRTGKPVRMGDPMFYKKMPWASYRFEVTKVLRPYTVSETYFTPRSYLGGPGGWTTVIPDEQIVFYRGNLFTTTGIRSYWTWRKFGPIQIPWREKVLTAKEIGTMWVKYKPKVPIEPAPPYRVGDPKQYAASFSKYLKDYAKSGGISVRQQLLLKPGIAVTEFAKPTPPTRLYVPVIERGVSVGLGAGLGALTSILTGRRVSVRPTIKTITKVRPVQAISQFMSSAQVQAQLAAQIQTQAQVQAQIQSQIQMTTQQTMRQTLRPTPTVYAPFIFPIFPLPPRKRPKLLPREKGYVAQVRRRGKWISVSPPVRKGVAQSIGADVAIRTAARSYRVLPSKFPAQEMRAPTLPTLWQQMFRAPKSVQLKKAGARVEKSKYAIDRPGERREITDQGLLALRRVIGRAA